MAAGTVVVTADTLISCATASGGTYDVINDLNTYAVNSDRPIKKFPVFQGATHSVPDPRAVKVTLNGYVSQGDTGQDRLSHGEQANVIVYLKVLPDGTNGSLFPVRPGTRNQDGDVEGGLHKVSWECAVDGAITEVGTGTNWAELAS